MSDRRPIPWLKAIWIAVSMVIAASFIWFAETSFFSSASSLAVVRKFGYIAFVIGLLVALGVVGFLWWREQRQDERENGSKDT